MLAAYTGHEPLTFQDYADLDTGQTLAAVPGGVYDVAPASGRTVPEIPEGWFTPVDAADDAEIDEADQAEAEPEPGDEG